MHPWPLKQITTCDKWGQIHTSWIHLRSPWLLLFPLTFDWGSMCLASHSDYSIGIIKVWAFLPKNTTWKPAKNLLCDSMAALVGHNQAQKCLQINSKLLHYYKLLWNFKKILLTSYLTDWRLQTSITRYPLRLWTWFLHSSTLLHPKMCFFANCSSSNARIMVLPKFSFVLHSFLHYSITAQVTICGSAASWLHGRLHNCSDCRRVYDHFSFWSDTSNKK